MSKFNYGDKARAGGKKSDGYGGKMGSGGKGGKGGKAASSMPGPIDPRKVDGKVARSNRMYTPAEKKPKAKNNKPPKMIEKDTKTFLRPGFDHKRGTISPSPSMSATHDQGTSSYMGNEAATPTGSRPGPSRYPLSSSAPVNPHMIRPAPDPLK